MGVPTSNVRASAQSGSGTLAIDLKPGPHAYVTGGLVWPLGDRFSLGGHLRGQASRFRSEVEECDDGGCSDPTVDLWGVTVEGRLTWRAAAGIQPYVLVGLGVVRVAGESVTVASTNTTYESVSVTDAGGDVGLGASIPVVGGLSLHPEIRVTGALPGGKENAVTGLPFSVGLSYRF